MTAEITQFFISVAHTIKTHVNVQSHYTGKKNQQDKKELAAEPI